MKRRLSYWSSLRQAVRSLIAGLVRTGLHAFRARRHSRNFSISSLEYFSQQQGITTASWPHVLPSIPENGRYRLHNEIDDCIVCDKCAKICPVNCITIEPIRSAVEFGKTSDGTSRRIYAARFDIDMGKCCFCGLCTTVCPTECLTMTPVFNYSTFDIRTHNVPFSNMTPEDIADRREEWQQHQQSKTSPKG